MWLTFGPRALGTCGSSAGVQGGSDHREKNLSSPCSGQRVPVPPRKVKKETTSIHPDHSNSPNTCDIESNPHFFCLEKLKAKGAALPAFLA